MPAIRAQPDGARYVGDLEPGLAVTMVVKKPPQRSQKKPVKRAERAPKPALQVKAFKTPAAFQRWLATHQASSPGLWLQLMKKASGRQSMSYQEALDVALCWGWIDGQVKPHDEASWLRKFVPRGARSIWSKINRAKALALIAVGRMQPPGLVQVERAKSDGRWQAAYDSPQNAKVPPDFAAALAQSARASAFFSELNAANRYAVLFRVQAPKKPETRARKIRELVAMLERGERIHG